MSAASDHGHHNPIPKYLVTFFALLIATLVEALPLFGLLAIPPAVLLALSAVKFAIVVLIFMHLLGDHPMFWRVFWIPLGMAGLTVSVLITLFGSWTLSYQEVGGKKDSDAVAACYKARFSGECAAWAKSPFTHNEYCAAPRVHPGDACQPLNTIDTTMAALTPKAKVADPRFEGFDAKDAEGKKAVLMEVGKEVYEGKCGSCHQSTGAGIPGAFPPLANDPVATGAPEEHIKIVLNGLNGKAINGVSYGAAMPAWPQLSNEEIAAAISYERNSWGNSSGVVEPSAVAAAR